MSRSARAAVLLLASAFISAELVTIPVSVRVPVERNDGRRLDAGVVRDPLVGCSSVTFAVQVRLGGQSVSLILDTGSTTLAVASDLCPLAPAPFGATGPCGRFPYYSPASSTSAIDQGTTASGLYGDGSGWDGNIYADTIQVGGSAPVSGFRFAAMTSASSSFFSSLNCYNNGQPTALNSQGIMGLAYTALALTGTDSWLDAYLAANPTTAAVFALQMCLFTGRLWLGGWDPTFTSAPPVWIKVIDPLYYTVSVQSMRIGGVSYGVASDFDDAILDSGTTMTILPDAIYNALVARITADSNFVSIFGANFFSDTANANHLPTQTIAQLNALLPAITLSFLAADGVQTTSVTLLPVPTYLRTIPVVDPTTFVETLFFYPGITSRGAQTHTIFGWTTLSQFVSIWSRSNSSVGLAPVRYCDGSLPPGVAENLEWLTSAWSPCADSLQYRSVQCADQNRMQYAPSRCVNVLATAAPASSQACSTLSPSITASVAASPSITASVAASPSITASVAASPSFTPSASKSVPTLVQAYIVFAGLPALNASSVGAAVSIFSSSLAAAISSASSQAGGPPVATVSITGLLQTNSSSGEVFFAWSLTNARRLNGVNDTAAALAAAQTQTALNFTVLASSPANAAAVSTAIVSSGTQASLLASIPSFACSSAFALFCAASNVTIAAVSNYVVVASSSATPTATPSPSGTGAAVLATTASPSASAFPYGILIGAIVAFLLVFGIIVAVVCKYCCKTTPASGPATPDQIDAQMQQQQQQQEEGQGQDEQGDDDPQIVQQQQQRFPPQQIVIGQQAGRQLSLKSMGAYNARIVPT